MNRNKVIQKICRLVIQGLIPNVLTWLFLLLFIGSQFFSYPLLEHLLKVRKLQKSVDFELDHLLKYNISIIQTV